MVDTLAAARHAPDQTIHYALRPATSDALAEYRDFAANAATGASQHPLWVERWLALSGNRGHILWLTRDNRPLAALPLEAVSSRGVRVLRLVGGSHANGNFGAQAKGASVRADLADIEAAIRRDAPDIDLLALERLRDAMDGEANMLHALASRDSPNIALAASLAGGFLGLLERANGKKKNKKRRAQHRKFEEAGGARLFQASTAAEVDAILDDFFRMKRARFEKAGIADVFGDPKVQSFWRDLFKASLDRSPPPFTLEALEVGGRVRAITGSSHLGDRTVCEFGAIEDDDLTSISPGEFLAYSNIEAACGAELAFYDFSVGDEAYKRSWCDTEIVHFDLVVPLTARGRIAAGAGALAASAKHAIKSRPALWAFVKRLRQQR